MTISSSGVMFNGSNGSIIVTLPSPQVIVANIVGISTSSNTINLTVFQSGGVESLSSLTDVQANTAQDGYVLAVNTHGTANTSDDTYYFEPENLDGGGF